MELSKQIEIIEHIRILLSGELKDRINSILMKNPDYQKLVKTVINENLDISKMKFLSLSTVDVERSFSILRKVLNDRTYKMSQKSINHYMIVRFNKLMEYVD